MEKLKQISVKINPETLEKIDLIAKQYGYRTRNSIINNVLTTIFFEADYKTIHKLMSYWRYSGKHLKIDVTEDNANR